MNLASHYAAVLADIDPKRVVAYMKSRGHLSLLPQVVRILERTPGKDVTVVRVAKKDDIAKYKQGIEVALKTVGSENRRLEIDSNVVGGYAVIGNGKAIDKTFRTVLVSMYQKIIS